MPGRVWVVTEPGLPMRFGALVLPGRGAVIIHDRGVMPHPSGVSLPIRRVSQRDAAFFTQDQVKRFVRLSGESPPDRHGLPGSSGDGSDDGEEDCEGGEGRARVLGIEYDAEGVRFKSWTDVCNESKEYSCSDFPLDGPVSCVELFRHMERYGGNPKAWFTNYSSDKGLVATDRNYQELETLCEALLHFGSYDQLNGGACASAEVLARRVFGIVDALSSGRDATATATVFGGVSASVLKEMRTYARRGSDGEIDAARARGYDRRSWMGGAHPGYPPK